MEHLFTEEIQNDIEYLTDNGYVNDNYNIIGSASDVDGKRRAVC